MYIGPSRASAEGRSDRVCFLTGAGGTLGSAFCRHYASQYQIVAVYHKKPPRVPSQSRWLIDPLEPDAHLPENTHRVHAIQANLLDDSEILRVLDLALARYGQMDLIINAAVNSVWAPLVDSRECIDSFDAQFHLNVLTPLKLAAFAAQKTWRAQSEENIRRNRNVVNVSSVAGLRLYRGLGQSIYSASKAALNQLTFHMAQEFRAFGVRVNAIAPNSFPQIVPVEQVAEAIVRLDQGQMAGKILVLDETGERLIGLEPFN